MLEEFTQLDEPPPELLPLVVPPELATEPPLEELDPDEPLPVAVLLEPLLPELEPEPEPEEALEPEDELLPELEFVVPPEFVVLFPDELPELEVELPLDEELLLDELEPVAPGPLSHTLT